MASAVPDSGSTLLLLGFGLATLFASRLRSFPRLDSLPTGST
jgi:VPDSG-CTERM motif